MPDRNFITGAGDFRAGVYEEGHDGLSGDMVREVWAVLLGQRDGVDADGDAVRAGAAGWDANGD